MIKKIFKILILIIVLLGFIGALLAGIYSYRIVSNAKPIDPKSIYSNISKTSYLYDSNGKTVSELNFGEHRDLVSIDDMPKNLTNAFIAIEDKTFYSHHGINLKRTLGAVIYKLTGKADSISGTSTITQQLARNVYLPEIKSERSIERKITELYYALLIEKQLSKKEILEAYLNTVYFGYQTYGIETAAKTYFSKDVKDLELKECAALAALPQAPDTYSLLKDEDGDSRTKIKNTNIYCNDISKDRRFLVLDLMYDQNMISKEERDSSKVELSSFIDPTIDHENKKYTYFNDYVISQTISDLMSEYSISEDEAVDLVYTGGIKIYSTLDSKIQSIIYDEFLDDDNYPYSEEEPQSAMVVCENKTGKVLAMVGGRKTSGKKLYNRAVEPRQPGSSIKPLSVYSAALQKSYDLAEKGEKWEFEDFDHDRQGASGWGNYITASSKVIDEKMYFNGKIWPYNANKYFTGYNTVRRALQQSINTCAVKIQLQVGNDYSLNMLNKYGISTLKESGRSNDSNPAALALGAMTYGTTPLDMALAYSTFPNKGIRNSAVCYTKVVDENGNVLLTGETNKTKVLDPGVAWIMTDMLQSVVSRGIGYPAAISGVKVGGKTGTTNDQNDIWFDGFTPKYSASLWIGTDNNKELSSMSEKAAALWSEIMEQIPDIEEGKYPKQPNNIIYKNGEYYTDGTEPYRRY